MPDNKLLIFGELQFDATHIRRVEQLGCTVDHLPKDANPDAVHEALKASRFVVFNNVDINPYLESFKTVDLGVLAATGYEFIDVKRASELGLNLAHLTNYSADSVVEYMIWAAITALRPLDKAARQGRDGNWEKKGLRGRDMLGLTAGVIGYGEVGNRLVPRLQALQVRVQITERQQQPESPDPFCPLDQLVEASDVVFVCCSSNPTSHRLLNADILNRLKDDAVLVSISPNDVIDLEALAAVLQVKPEAHAVLDLDPIPDSHALKRCENVVITPHVAFLTAGTLENRVDMCIKTIEAFVQDKPVHYIKETT